MAGVGLRHAGPWARKMSATSSVGRAMRAAVRRAAIASVEVEAQPVERAGDVADRVDGDAGVERRRLQLGVAEQYLDHADVDALFEQMGGEAVPQGMRRHALGDPGPRAAACTARTSWRVTSG